MSGRFGRVATAMVTPFDGEGELDLDAAAELARWLVEHGSDALVLAGTTGEASTLDDAEKLDLWRAVSEAVTVPVIAGSGSNDTRHTVELTAAASATGVAAVLIVGPYYNRPAQSGIEAHLAAAAGATTLPVMIYDVPSRTGKRIDPEVVLRLNADRPNVVAFKDATGDPVGTARLIAAAGGGLEVYSGDDALTLPLLAVGAVGVVGVSTHWAGPHFQEMISAFEKGDVDHARAVHRRLLPTFAFANTEHSPYSVSTKAMMRTLGFAVGECRLPLGPAPAGVEDHARRVWAQLNGEQSTK